MVWKEQGTEPDGCLGLPGRKSDKGKSPPRGRGRGKASTRRLEAGWRDRIRTMSFKALNAT